MKTSRLSAPMAMGLAILTFVGGAVVVSTTTHGNSGRVMAPPASPVIAVVRLDAVVDGLQEREGKQLRYEAQRDEFRKVIETLQTEIDDLVEGLEVIKSEQQPEHMMNIRRLQQQKQFELQYSDAFLAEMQSDMLRDLFRKIDQAVDVIAERNGYTLVISSDEGVAIQPGSYAEVTRAIAVRRILHVDPAHDVTDDVIAYMNNQYAVGGTP